MWKITFHTDPTHQSNILQTKNGTTKNSFHAATSILLKIDVKLSFLLQSNEQHNMNTLKIFQSIKERDVLLLSLCDYISRQINTIDNARNDNESFQISTLDIIQLNKKKRNNEIPFILERSDVIYHNENDCMIQINCRLHCDDESKMNVFDKCIETKEITISPSSEQTSIPLELYTYLTNYLSKLQSQLLTTKPSNKVTMMEHISSILLQERIRSKIQKENAIAFISNGSILPRKHSNSYEPLKTAIPFLMNNEASCMYTTLSIDMDCLYDFIAPILPQKQDTHSTFIKLDGLIIQKGITLIVGGAYHGKSTLLNTISMGIYNKIPNDGREYCITHPTALNIRSEDGRYVAPYTNISAFLSDLPIPMDMSKFHTNQASGSTSMAANVMEGIELQSKVFLIDEDLSATNFMSRDGRMRALIANESLTPLLYRINSIYTTFDISSIVVIGGVGDWLDVPNNVILLDKYNVYDATAKAKSISETFSYGHVQYAGRGVVHRLDWDVFTMNPYRRCIHEDSLVLFQNADLSLGNDDSTISHRYSLSLIPRVSSSHDEDDQIGCIDVHRCEQMMHNLPQYIYGCVLCIQYIIHKLNREKEKQYDLSSIMKLISDVPLHEIVTSNASNGVGYVMKPRCIDILCMLLRIRGLKFKILPNLELEEELERQRLEKERKQKELMDLWNSRR